jgi:hypothetical protein
MTSGIQRTGIFGNSALLIALINFKLVCMLIFGLLIRSAFPRELEEFHCAQFFSL